MPETTTKKNGTARPRAKAPARAARAPKASPSPPAALAAIADASIDDLERKHRHLVRPPGHASVCGAPHDVTVVHQSFVYVRTEAERVYWVEGDGQRSACPACIATLRDAGPIEEPTVPASPAPPPVDESPEPVFAHAVPWLAFFDGGNFALAIGVTREDASRHLQRLGIAVDPRDLSPAGAGDAFAFAVDPAVSEHDGGRTPLVVTHVSDDLRSRIAAHAEICALHLQWDDPNEEIVNDDRPVAHAAFV